MVEKEADKAIRFLSYISEDRLKTIVSTIKDHRTKLILEVLYETGCTVKELVSLKPSNIKAQAIVFASKEKKISEKLYRELLEFIVLGQVGFDKFLFSTKDKPLSPKRIEQLCKEIEPTLSPKVLKDSFVINNLESEKDFEYNVFSRQDVLEKISFSGNVKLQLITHMLLEGEDLEKILTIKVNDALLEKYEFLKKQILREHNHRSEFLFSSRATPLTRRRIEQSFSDIGLKSKDIERILLLETILQKANSISKEDKEWYDKCINDRCIVVRRSGFVEVYRW